MRQGVRSSIQRRSSGRLSERPGRAATSPLDTADDAPNSSTPIVPTTDTHTPPPRACARSHFLVFLFIAGVAGVIAFAILAVTTQNSKMSCPCANPYKQIGYERILDMSECQKDNAFKMCTEKKQQLWIRYTGLAGGSGGLLCVALLLMRYG